MNIPIIPTDSLYKFMALAGIVLIIFSYVIPYKNSEELDFLIIEVGEELEIIERKQKALDLEFSWFEKLSPQEQMKVIKEISEYHIETGILLAKLKSKQEKCKLLFSKNKAWDKIFNLFFWIGLILSFSGFVFWYIFIQNPQDQLLRKRLARYNNLPSEQTKDKELEQKD